MHEGFYIFGGLLKEGVVNDQLYCLKLVDWKGSFGNEQGIMKFEWKTQEQLGVSGNLPGGRFDHAMQRF